MTSTNANSRVRYVSSSKFPASPLPHRTAAKKVLEHQVHPQQSTSSTSHIAQMSFRERLPNPAQGTKRKLQADDLQTESRRPPSHYHQRDIERSSHGKQKPWRRQKPKTSKPEPARISEARLQLLRSRADLPIWPHVSHIRLSLRDSRHVLILVGATGSGKSTQVPQLLMTEAWCTRGIAVTQPRRVAAISLARRVAEEVGTPLGKQSPASQVGYSIRFDQNFSPNSKIKFLTEGMLLHELLRDPLLRQYSLVVVDEVHERSVNVDLILGFLKRILHEQFSSQKPPTAWRKGAGPLKVVIMSATADTLKFFQFFEEVFQAPHPEKPTNRIINGDLAGSGNGSIDQEDGPEFSDSSWSGCSSPHTDGDESTSTHSSATPQIVTAISDHISTMYIEGRQHPVETLYLPQPVEDYMETALKTIIQVHYKEPLPGDILVFLPGQDTIEAMESVLNDHAPAMGPDVPKLLTIPLFAGLSQSAQQQAFIPTPIRTRKVILATNIAETSVTIPGVAHVIDTGLHKSREFRPRLGLDTLLVRPVAQTNAIQRQGRAGRQGPGKCYRLYTEETYLALNEAEPPEILRCDLADSLLIMKSRRIANVESFPFLDPPERDKMRKAHFSLRDLEAIDERNFITKTGLKMARLPLPPHLARVLLVAAKPEHNCLLDAIDVVACLAGENVFMQLGSEEVREQAEDARRELFRREGDHLTMHAAVQAYAAEHADRKAWCRKHFVNHRSMKNVLKIRKQLRSQCEALGLTRQVAQVEDSDQLAAAVDSAALLKSLLRGFGANIASLQPDASYKNVAAKQIVAIHPSSVLFGRQRKPEHIMYSELVFTSKCWARCVSELDSSWIAGTAEPFQDLNGHANI